MTLTKVVIAPCDIMTLTKALIAPCDIMKLTKVVIAPCDIMKLTKVVIVLCDIMTLTKVVSLTIKRKIDKKLHVPLRSALDRTRFIQPSIHKFSTCIDFCFNTGRKPSCDEFM
jgi:hypothetical protein